MPITSQALVESVRELCQILETGSKRYRNGYTGDTDTTLIPILPRLNDYLSILSLTAIKTDDRTEVMAGDTRIISPDSDVSGVLAVYDSSGLPLRKTTRQGLDEAEPAWRGRTGNATRYFREGNRIILDANPAANTTFTLTCAINLTPFLPANSAQLLDSAIPDSAAQRLPFGAAYLQGILDAGNTEQSRRVGTWQQMAQGVIDELRACTDSQDYASSVSLDDWISRPRVALPSRPMYPLIPNAADTS